MAQTLDDIPKDELVRPDGARYKDFRRTLSPDYTRTWIELLLGHAAVAASAAGLALAESALGAGAAPLVPLGAVAIGCGMAYIQLFFHEASHYNLASDKRTNDVMANLLIGSLVGQDIRAYRPIHWDHHRFLGTPADTEHTYFDPLDLRFFAESLTGVKLAKVMLGREKAAQEKASGAPRQKGNEAVGTAPAAPAKSLLNGQLLLGLAIHGAVVGGALWKGKWALAAGWTLGTACVLPFFMAVRQVVEHRSTEASPETDYSKEPHGEVHRLFGDSLLSRIVGGAGFNRHLLHHYDPQLSHTRLKDLEDFLMETPAAPVLRAARTTYTETFMALVRGGSKRA